MFIQDMFREDIHRKINGVIKVDQNAVDVIEQEVREYVITKELKKHFISFFNFYGDAFNEPTADVGVWISGFFGSGKSHFLKMLSYILENRDVNGVKTVDLFREKFEDDPATFMLIDKATRAETEAILFNVDIQSSINKDDTAVLRVMAKVFFNHLGFYGEDLKVAMLEKFIDQEGKTEEFRRVFEQKKGKPWIEQRKAYAFNGKIVVQTLVEVLDMSESDAQAWLKDKSVVNYSIAQLVDDIKAYVNSKPDNFRLLFMIDEVGQYIGENTSLLLNLQSIVEKLGSECQGKVWVICTGQEAIDEIIKVRTDEFSRIQARFKTRLSLTSSSVDEVIQKRILKKKEAAATKLVSLYHDNDSVLRNLFTFSNAVLDIKGYSGSQEFSDNFPFVPYQFIIMQKVFAEIRKHGNAGKHFSGGERSMLSGFQEAAQALCRENKDQYALVPFYLFYDTVHTFLDGAIRRVIERCQNAADAGNGLENYDVSVLKLLYLIRYVNDIPSKIENIAILMADDIRTDKIQLRDKVRKSLERLLSQNYIGRSGDCWNFLTDEEQDIQREIKNTSVDTAAIVERISQLIYGDIYQTKKYRYGKYDFDFDKLVDGVGSVSDAMKLRFLTAASDQIEKNDLSLRVESKKQAIVVLADTSYYDSLESSMKIRKYIKQRNVAQLPKTIQEIIRNQQEEANVYDENATEALRKAILEAKFYVDGERLNPKGSDAKGKIDQALEYLVVHVYSELDLITKNCESDQEIVQILSGKIQKDLNGQVPNIGAASKVEEYLEIQHTKNLPTSMADIQSRYQALPYGWKEIDIAAVIAQLIFDQKVTVKYAGDTIQACDPKLVNLLRKKNEVGKTIVSKRQSVNASNMKQAKSFLREYFDVMDVPDDEDGLVNFIITRFDAQKKHYNDLLNRYLIRAYPDEEMVKQAIQLVTDILSNQKDNIALVSFVIKYQDDLLDSKDDMQNVEAFFKNQVQIFDSAAKLISNLENELDYLAKSEEAFNALNSIRQRINVQGKFNYKGIPELNTLMKTVTDGYTVLLLAKRSELLEIVRQCMETIHNAAGNHKLAKSESDKADAFYTQKKQRISELEVLSLLDAMVPALVEQKDETCARIKDILTPEPVVKTGTPSPKKSPKNSAYAAPLTVKKPVHTYNRSVIFPSERIDDETQLDEYLARVRKQLVEYLSKGECIQLK